MRTPVNALACAAALLAERAASPDADDADAPDAPAALLCTVRACCRLMETTLGNAADVRLDAVSPSSGSGCAVDLAAALRGALYTCARGLQRRVEWAADSASDTPSLTMNADADALERLLLNLATAALSFTPPGTRCVASLHAAAPASPRQRLRAVEVSFVAEGAPYMDAAARSAAFDADAGGGSGLALRAARRSARALRGDVLLASCGPEGGVCLTATLRLPSASTAARDCALALAQHAVISPSDARDDGVLSPSPPPPPAAQLSARMLEHLVRTSDELYHTGTIGADGSFLFSYVSPAIEREYGFAAAELLGTSPMAFTHPDDVARCGAAFGAALASLGAAGEGSEEEAFARVAVARRFARADGSWAYVRTMGAITRDRWFCLCKDVSCQLGRDEALRRLLQALSRALREPACSALAAVELLAGAGGGADDDDADDEESDAALLRALRAGASMLMSTVDNALSAQAAAAGELPFSPAPFDPAAAIADVVAVARAAACSARAVALAPPCVAAPLPARVGGCDAALLSRALQNLVANACRFGCHGAAPAAPVTVAATCVPRRDASDADACELRIAVRDHGPGIADVSRLFQPFEAAPACQGGGLGLGLFIARAAARRLGGDVHVTPSPPGGGALFTLAVPVTALPQLPPPLSPTTPRAAAWAPPSPSPRVSRTTYEPSSPEEPPQLALRVLLVDDAPLNLRLVAALLLRHGFASVATAADGEQALQMLVADGEDGDAPPPRFDCALVDMQMPRMTGPQCTRAFRAWEAAQSRDGPLRLPVVAFTANALEDAAAECRGAGMCDVATKPLRADAIAALHARATAYARQQREAAQAHQQG